MLISNLKRLFQIIKSFIQFINLNIIFIKAVKLLHINILLNIVIKKNDFDIHLFHVLIHNRRKRKNYFIIYKFYYRRENIMIITILLLFEFSNNLTCFIMSDFPLKTSFHDVNSTIFKDTSL